MHETHETTCHHCRTSVMVENAIPGGFFVCPSCGQRNAIASRQPGRTRGPAYWKGVAIGLVIAGIFIAWFEFGRNGSDSSGTGSSGTDHSANAAAFMGIADAQGSSFSASATKTRERLSQFEVLLRGANGGPTLDPRIRDFASMQIECNQTFSRFAASEEEAYANWAAIPLEAWEMQRRYHQRAKELCAVYAPEWGRNLADRIAEDDEIIRRIKASR